MLDIGAGKAGQCCSRPGGDGCQHRDGGPPWFLIEGGPDASTPPRPGRDLGLPAPHVEFRSELGALAYGIVTGTETGGSPGTSCGGSLPRRSAWRSNPAAPQGNDPAGHLGRGSAPTSSILRDRGRQRPQVDRIRRLRRTARLVALDRRRRDRQRHRARLPLRRCRRMWRGPGTALTSSPAAAGWVNDILDGRDRRLVHDAARLLAPARMTAAQRGARLGRLGQGLRRRSRYASATSPRPAADDSPGCRLA